MSASASQGANPFSYGELGAGGFSLGYPVPLPFESQTPVAGFRSYASLHARHQALAMQHSDMQGSQVGQAFNGRAIWAYRMSDADTLTSDGETEPAFLINGAIHALEWQTPEVTTAIIEQLMAGADGHGIERYPLDEASVIVLPVLNIDGFLQTRRYPTQILVGEDPTDRSWPRDGRMRRKNMRNVDEILNTHVDHLNGIDRNHSPFWGGGSGNVRNLTYRGTAPNSEPETMALLAAAELGPVAALRSFDDVHSYSRVLLVPNTGVTEQDHTANALAGLFAYAESAYSPPGHCEYSNLAEGINSGVGTAADHFGYELQISSWTLEVEPGDDGATDYGGIGANHDGFILQAREIERVRNSIYQAQRLVFYRMAGNAYVREVRVLDANKGQLMYEAGWRKQGSSRTLEIRRVLPLQPGGNYRLWLGFNKPMRLRENGVVSQIPNRNELSIALDPSVSLIDNGVSTALPASSGHWLNHPGTAGFGYQRWVDDAYAIDFSVPANTSGNLRLAVDAQDISGDRLDADPSSVVNWQGTWVGFQSSFPNGDQQHLLRVSANSGAMVRLAEWPPVLAEGDSVRLRLTRTDASRRAVVNVHSEFIDSSAADFVPIAIQGLILEPGSDAELMLQTREDLLAEPNRHLRLRFDAGDATTELADQVLDLELVDNDRSTAHWRIAPNETSTSTPTEELQAAMSAANLAAITTMIDLPANTILLAPESVGDDSFAPISGKVMVDGHGSRLQASSSARLFDVLPGGNLDLTGLRLTAPETALVAGNGGLIRNAGRLELTKVDLVGGHAQRGGQIHNSAAAVMHRVRMIGGMADDGGAHIYNSGDLQLQTTQLLQAAGGNGALWNEGTGLLQSISLIDSQAQPAIRVSGGALHVNNSLLANAVNCAAGAVLISDGGNLDSDGSCRLGNLNGSAGAVSLISANGLPLALPGNAAVDTGSDCPNQDYRGTARPQGAAGRCDIGAIEAGVQPALGLWHDPSSDGSGFAIDLVGNLLFVVWYTYDAQGLPIAYTAQNLLQGEQWSAPMLRFARAADGSISNQPVGTLSLQFTASEHAQASFSFAEGGSGSLELQHLHFAAGANTLGVRGSWASPEFPYQGLSVVDQGQTLVVLTYFYDATGQLRWSLGTDAVHQASAMSMLRFTGSCPSCPYLPPRSHLSGGVELVFDGQDHAQIHATLTANDGGEWIATGNAINAFR